MKKKMYNQPTSEVMEVRSMMLMSDGSVQFGTDPNGSGVGGNAPERKVF